MTQQAFIRIFLVIITTQFCIAEHVSPLYSSIDFPHNGAYINTHQPVIVGVLRDNQERVVAYETVQVFVDDIELGTAISDTDGIYRFFLGQQEIPDGKHSVAVFCIESQVLLGSQQFTVDTTLPPITILLPLENEIITNSQVTASGTTEENAKVSVFLNGNTYDDTCYADELGNWSIDYNLANGFHTIRAQATDLAGNEGPLSDIRNFSIIIL